MYKTFILAIHGYMKTGIIILNYNNYEDTINCIESVEKFNTSPVKLIVVDNGSKRQGVVDKLNEFFQNRYGKRYQAVKEYIDVVPYTLNYLTFLISATNDGYARGNNKGLDLAYRDSEIDKIMILNNDILFVEDIIPKLIDTMEELPNCAIISPILYKKDLIEIDYTCARRNIQTGSIIKENFFHYWYELNKEKYAKRKSYYFLLNDSQKSKSTVMPIELPSGSCMLIKKNLFQEIGSFDPGTFLYYEENILFKKIEKRGLQNYLCTHLKCIHLGGISISTTGNIFMMKCLVKSRIYYMKNYSGCSWATYLLFRLSTYFFLSCFYLKQKLTKKK